jgi:hypothetical protein
MIRKASSERDGLGFGASLSGARPDEAQVGVIWKGRHPPRNGLFAQRHKPGEHGTEAPHPALLFCCDGHRCSPCPVITSRNSWVRSLLIGLAVFAGWLVVAVTTYQESPDDRPMIVALFSK